MKIHYSNLFKINFGIVIFKVRENQKSLIKNEITKLQLNKNIIYL